jgi:hypothetical protein
MDWNREGLALVDDIWEVVQKAGEGADTGQRGGLQGSPIRPGGNIYS